MGQVLKFPPQLRVVEGKSFPSFEYRNREIAAIADYTASATLLFINTAKLQTIDESGFVRAQHELEAALFHACSLNGACEIDRNLMDLLALRQMMRERTTVR